MELSDWYCAAACVIARGDFLVVVRASGQPCDIYCLCSGSLLPQLSTYSTSVAFWFSPNPLLIHHRIVLRDEKHLPPNYYNLNTSAQSRLFAAYLALVGCLLAAMTSNNQRRKSPKRLQSEQNGEWMTSDIDNADDIWDQFKP